MGLCVGGVSLAVVVAKVVVFCIVGGKARSVLL